MPNESVPTLKREPQPIKQVMPKLRVVVYGDGGVGKTTFALSFPNPLVVDTDGGLEGDAVIGTNGEEWSPEGWQDLNALYLYLKAKVAKGKYETIVIDSATLLAQFLLHEAMAQPSKSRRLNAHLTEMIQAEQGDYGKVQRAMEVFLANLRKLNVHIVLTGSVRDPDPEKGRMKRQINVPPAVEDAIEHWSNVYGELTVTMVKGEESRILHTRSSDPERKGKTRIGALHPGVLNPTYDKMRESIEKRLRSTNQTNTPKEASK